LGCFGDEEIGHALGDEVEGTDKLVVLVDVFVVVIEIDLLLFRTFDWDIGE
jgi:hypothetical protein